MPFIKEKYVYWSKCNWRDLSFSLAATDHGLCYVSSPNASFSELEQWVQKQLPDHFLIEMSEKLSTAASQLHAYLDEEQTNFSLPLDIIGTDFQKKVWQSMCKIPYGKTTTYGNIAKDIGNTKAVRAVGSAIGANPLMIILPCHRIVAQNGSLTGFRGGLELKKKLLALEKHHVQQS